MIRLAPPFRLLYWYAIASAALAAAVVLAALAAQLASAQQAQPAAAASHTDTPKATDGAATAGTATSPADEQPLRDPSVLVRLIRCEAVQNDLTLKPAQQKALDDLVAEVDYPLFVLRDLPAADKRDRLNKLADTVEAELKRGLTDAQQRRLFEITFRAEGWPALLAPEPARALRLTPDQSARIRQTLTDAATTAAAPAAAPADDDASATKAPATKAPPTLDERILALLKPDQKTSLEKLAGAPFDFSRVPQVACPAPELRDVTAWLNSEPLTLSGLRGQVVVLHFFAFGCINCVHNQPHYRAWQERFADRPVTILGIHTPETKREHDIKQVKADLRAKQLTFPVAVDNDLKNWEAWGNHIWPAVYLIDRRGYVRYWWYGELNWEGAGGEELMRKRIEELMAEKS